MDDDDLDPMGLMIGVFFLLTFGMALLAVVVKFAIELWKGLFQ